MLGDLGKLPTLEWFSQQDRSVTLSLRDANRALCPFLADRAQCPEEIVFCW